jgi:hypothetical protein
MPGKIEALAIFLLLLPGFTSAYVTQLLSVRRGQSDLDKVVEALLFSFLLFLITWPIFGYSLPLAWELGKDAQFHVHVAYSFLITLFVLAVMLGILYAANLNHDWILTLCRKCRITERTSRVAVWHDVFQGGGGWVQVSLKNGKKALGWVRYYSDDAEDRSLFLEQASWITDEGDEEPIPGPGLFLTKSSEIESVMFLELELRSASEDGERI